MVTFPRFALCEREIVVDVSIAHTRRKTGHALARAPFSFCALAGTTRDGVFVFGLVEVAFAAFCAARAGVYAEVFAEVAVAFGFFGFVVFVVGFLVGVLVVDVYVFLVVESCSASRWPSTTTVLCVWF